MSDATRNYACVWRDGVPSRRAIKEDGYRAEWSETLNDVRVELAGVWNECEGERLSWTWNREQNRARTRELKNLNR